MNLDLNQGREFYGNFGDAEEIAGSESDEYLWTLKAKVKNDAAANTVTDIDSQMVFKIVFDVGKTDLVRKTVKRRHENPNERELRHYAKKQTDKSELLGRIMRSDSVDIDHIVSVRNGQRIAVQFRIRQRTIVDVHESSRR